MRGDRHCFFKLRGQVQRKIRLKALNLGGNAVMSTGERKVVKLMKGKWILQSCVEPYFNSPEFYR